MKVDLGILQEKLSQASLTTADLVSALLSALYEPHRSRNENG